MFASLKLKLLLGLYVFLILSIPVGAYLASQRQTTKSEAKEEKPPVTKPIEPTQSPKNITLPSVAPKNEKSSSTPATTFGPTLNLKLILEGRPVSKMASKIFVGIAEAAASTNISYLLSFNIDLPDSGEFEGISLAGLSAGSNYQAIIKGPAQIATSSAFTMSPTVSNLNNGQPLTLITGDLNEDNVINSADYSIAKSLYGATEGLPNWNENVDFNLDGKINSLDLSIIIKNMTKTGDSGLWISTPATGSAMLNDLNPMGTSATPSSYPSGNPGYWLWVPGF